MCSGDVYAGVDTGLSVGCISADKVRGEGEAFSTGMPDQRPAGERAGYQGKNNTLYRAAGIRGKDGGKKRGLVKKRAEGGGE